jgi:integrase
MAMAYQKGNVYEKDKRKKKWYGQFRVYRTDREGKEVIKVKRVVLGLKSELRKHEAEEKLSQIILRENGKERGVEVAIPLADDSVTFDWFVAEKYLLMQRSKWRIATRYKTEFEINKYVVQPLKGVPLRTVGLFDLQMLVNKLAEKYSKSIVKHAFANVRSIMRMARKLKYITDNPGQDIEMPETRAVAKPKLRTEQIGQIIDNITDPHDLCLMCIALFCATRTSETFGLQWRSYTGDQLMIQNTAFEGRLYESVKTEASRDVVAIPDEIRPIIERWRRLSEDTSPEALMFPTFGRKSRKGTSVPRHAKNFLKWRIQPITDKLGIPRKLVTFQVMRRTLGTDLQRHGSMKDTQAALRHASIKTTADVYVEPIAASVRAALNSRTKEVLAKTKIGSILEREAREGQKERGRVQPNATQFENDSHASA